MSYGHNAVHSQIMKTDCTWRHDIMQPRRVASAIFKKNVKPLSGCHFSSVGTTFAVVKREWLPWVCSNSVEVSKLRIWNYSIWDSRGSWFKLFNVYTSHEIIQLHVLVPIIAEVDCARATENLLVCAFKWCVSIMAILQWQSKWKFKSVKADLNFQKMMFGLFPVGFTLKTDGLNVWLYKFTGQRNSQLILWEHFSGLGLVFLSAM